MEDKQRFFDGIRRSQENATRYLEQYPGDFEARYYLGACQSALGVFAFTIERSFRKALKYGKESYRIQRAIVDENPDFYDAYMTVGTLRICRRQSSLVRQMDRDPCGLSRQ